MGYIYRSFAITVHQKNMLLNRNNSIKSRLRSMQEIKALQLLLRKHMD